MNLIKKYVSLTKPGIIGGNVMVAMAAFIFGSPVAIDWGGFWFMATGLSLVIASACVFNNYFDRDIDTRMERTKTRLLAARAVSVTGALVFGVILLGLGAILLRHTGALALGAALAGFVSYVFLYTPLKHKSGYAVYVGAFSGATPPVVGYAAAAQVLDMNAAWLFIFLFLWQLPHFLAIAIYRYDEYTAAGVPLLVGNHTEKNRRRARKVFLYSLVVLLAFCALLILQRWMR